MDPLAGGRGGGGVVTAIESVPVPDPAAVAYRVVDFLVRTETERLSLFADHLRATVDRVSPLLPELALMEGVTLADALGLIQPPEDWPWRPIHGAPFGLYKLTRWSKGRVASPARSEAARFARTFARPGLVLRAPGHPRGAFAIRPTGRVLGFVSALGPCLLAAFGPTAMLKLREPLPETLVTAMPGRQIGALVDHPLFAGRGWKVLRVENDPSDDLPVLHFRAPLVPFAFPQRTGRP